ncbi:MAG TPA: amino acid permease [Pyrinomonadaceae bacterium]|jgi:APA family basic amino acid/polyamine antiporter
MQPEHNHLVRGLGLTAAIAVNVANVIGTGVFLKARVMTCNVGTPGKALAVWVFAGVLSLAGALTYAELLAMRPKDAGEYGIIRDGYGPVWGFIYGWTQFLLARSASAAALAVGFAIFLNDFLKGFNHSLSTVYFSFTIPFTDHVVPFGRLQVVALTAIAITTLINCAAVKVSGNFATVMTIIKVSVLILVGVGAFVYSGGDWSHLSEANVNGVCEGVAVTTGGFAGLAAALLGAMWAYDGWNNIAFMAGEVKQPERNLPRALLVSMLIIMGLYVFVNLSYYHVLTPTQIASVPASSSTAAEVVRRLLGATAVTLMAAAMMTSSFSALHASILATARVPYAMAKDRLFFTGLAKLSKTHVPVRSLIVLAIWSSVLALSGSYDVLTDMAIFALVMFYALTAGAIFIQRRRNPEEARPYRTWGYPVVPVLFIAICTWLILTTIWNTPKQSAIGLALMALGLPVYLHWRRTIKNGTSSR